MITPSISFLVATETSCLHSQSPKPALTSLAVNGNLVVVRAGADCDSDGLPWEVPRKTEPPLPLLSQLLSLCSSRYFHAPRKVQGVGTRKSGDIGLHLEINGNGTSLFPRTLCKTSGKDVYWPSQVCLLSAGTRTGKGNQVPGSGKSGTCCG